ncbi:hypothetical protein [Micromonospora endolithica]|uniref:Uncharacterized protein n=1 Tax=Micromonospora endolithica TaxID=230091 RepID=A0A3A9Z760_9ACTN|nr:hypothetical protein [Micromonospora endolithica]RKN44241.1 hypothetical protein D7223_18365 [Micromonospora endolithica]TWJ25707.1 hypothetical protein JD76_05880 [Micromonospora endolithica]
MSGTTTDPTGSALLRSTRVLTLVAALCLAVQLFGNLYEELVSNVAVLARPQPGEAVGALDAGSPLYYYLPWAPVGVILVAVLAHRMAVRGAPGWVVRRLRLALAALAVAVAAKALLISSVNPRFRDPAEEAATLRELAVVWAGVNGVAIVAVAVALTLLLSWRARVADHGVSGPARPAAPLVGVSAPSS